MVYMKAGQIKMTSTILRKWGNSVGIRIPQSDLTEANLSVGDTLDIRVSKTGKLILSKNESPRTGWLDQFNSVTELDQLLMDNLENNFDEKDWTW